MPNYTENLNLILPNKTEQYDVETANTNNKIIDTKMADKVDKVVGKGLSTNDFTDGYKKKIDSMQTLYRFKGTVDSISDLSIIENRNIGDTYKCTTDSNNYIWNGVEWINAGQDVDFSEILEQINTFQNETNNKIENKVDKVVGKDLSTNDFTNEYKRKLDNIEKAINGVSLVIELTETIAANTDYAITKKDTTTSTDIPFNYHVGSNDLVIFYCGTKMVKDKDYIEVGEVGLVSNIVQFTSTIGDLDMERCRRI